MSASRSSLVLEDMHWADSSTRTFVAFLAHSLRHERVMVVLSYRSDELHRRHPLRALIAELDRLERARRIELEPFDRGELTEALTDILGDAPAEELVTRLYPRSEGNPLYTEELLAAGLDGRGAAPASLRDAFLLRVERLSGDAQRAARAIAVGRLLDQATVAAGDRHRRDALTAALREAVDEQVLVNSRGERFAFRHALLREAVVDDLLPGERGELHLALARAFEQSCAIEHPGGDRGRGRDRLPLRRRRRPAGRAAREHRGRRGGAARPRLRRGRGAERPRARAVAARREPPGARRVRPCRRCSRWRPGPTR